MVGSGQAQPVKSRVIFFRPEVGGQRADFLSLILKSIRGEAHAPFFVFFTLLKVSKMLLV